VLHRPLALESHCKTPYAGSVAWIDDEHERDLTPLGQLQYTHQLSLVLQTHIESARLKLLNTLRNLPGNTQGIKIVIFSDQDIGGFFEPPRV